MLRRIRSLSERLVAWWKIPVTIVELEDDVRLTLAARQRDIYIKSHENCINHTVQVSVWMIGTLLVLNSGALVSIFSSEKAHKGTFDASWFFVFGICLAMLNGWLIQVVNLSNVRPCLIGSAYWDTIANGRTQNLQFEEDMERAELRRIRIAKFAQVPGWLSMGCFLAGVWELARYFPG